MEKSYLRRAAIFLVPRVRTFKLRYLYLAVRMVATFVAQVPRCWWLLGSRKLLAIWRAQLMGDGEPIVTQVRSLGRPIILRPLSSDVAVLKQIFVQGEYDITFDFEPNAILDGGANCGLSTVFFANRYPRSKIVAVEPDTNNFELLIRNVDGIPNIVPVNAAIWSEDSYATEVSGTQDTWSFQFREAPRGTSGGVTALSIHTLAAQTQLDNFDIVKLDIEGAEKALLESNYSWLSSAKVLIIEVHERYAPGITALLTERATQFGFEVRVSGENYVLVRQSRQSGGD